MGTLLQILLFVLFIAGWYRIFEKAGRQGWEAIIPIYNIWVITQLVGRAGWWIVLYFIPLVNIVIWIMDSIEVSKRFGKDAAWGVGLALLGFIFAPLLGFGEQYKWS